MRASRIRKRPMAIAPTAIAPIAAAPSANAPTASARAVLPVSIASVALSSVFSQYLSALLLAANFRFARNDRNMRWCFL
jgi:homoserine kinase